MRIGVEERLGGKANTKNAEQVAIQLNHNEPQQTKDERVVR